MYVTSMATKKALVVGSGVIGLKTTLELLRKNISVVLRSAHHPLDASTCSFGAGGLWMPYKCDDSRVSQWAKETLDELLPLATTLNNNNEKESWPLVEIVPLIYLKKSNHGPKIDHFLATDYKTQNRNQSQNNIATPLPEWTKDPRLSFQHLTIEMLSWQNQLFGMRIPTQDHMLQAGYTHAWFFRPPIINTTQMLSKMVSEIQNHPLQPDVQLTMKQKYTSIEQIIQDAKHHQCDTVVNCTGLGAKQLCQDSTLQGGRGILLHYDRASTPRRTDNWLDTTGIHGLQPHQMKDIAITVEEEPWGTSTEPCYIIPRGDRLVVGGSFLLENYDTEIKEHEFQRLLRNAYLMGIDTNKASPIYQWTGFRPSRPQIRLELDHEHPFALKNGIKLLHNYGHGGSGWTVFTGAAKAAVTLLLSTE